MGSVFRKGSVTQTGAQATSLSDPDLRQASFSREGVVDQSGLFRGEAKAAGLSGIAGGISDFGNIALDLDKRLSLMDLEKKVSEEAIDPFLESREPGFAEEQIRRENEAGFDAFVLDKTADALRITEGEGAAIEQLAPDYANVVKRLKNAESKGAMTTEELQVRIKALTREAISKRPGLMNELTAHAQNVLGLSGALEQAKHEDQLARAVEQQEAEFHKEIRSDLRKMHVEHDPFADINDLLQLRNNTFRKRSAYESIKNDEEIRQIVQQSSADEIANSGLPHKVVLGGFDTEVSNLIDLFSNVDNPQAYKDAVAQAELSSVGFRATIDGNVGYQKVANRPEFKKLRDDWTNSYGDVIETLKNFSNGGEAVAFLQNRLDSVRIADELKVHGQVSVKTVDTLAKIQSITGQLPIKDKDVQAPFLKLVDILKDGAVRAEDLALGFRDTMGAGKSNFAVAVGADSVQQFIPKSDDTPEQLRQKSPEDYSDMFDTVFQTIQNEPNIGNKNRVIKDIVKEMGNPNIRNFYANIPQETQSQIFSLLDQQSTIVANSVDDVMSKAQSEGIDVKTRFLPDGTMVFTSEDQSKKARDFLQRENRRVATAHREVVNAFSNVFGKSVPETSKMLRSVFTTQDRKSLFDALEGLEQDIQQRRGEDSVSLGDNSVLDRIIQIESGGDPNAKAKTSSALGLAQFTNGTWLDTVRRHEPELFSGRSEQEVLDLRTDPEISKRMLAFHTEANASTLKSRGIQGTPENLYLAHFLGIGGALNLLSESPDTPTDEVVSAAAIRANKSILENKTVGDVVDWAKKKMGVS